MFDFLDRDSLTAIKFGQSLSHRVDKVDLLGDVMQRSILCNGLKHVPNHLFDCHVASKSILGTVVYRHIASVARSALVHTVASAR